MTVRIRINKGQKPTNDQIKEINNAKKLRPVYDEDAPILTTEQLERYRAAALKRKSTTNGHEVSETKNKHVG